MVDTVRTEAGLLTIFSADKVFVDEVPIRAKRASQIKAQDVRDLIVSLKSLNVVQKTATYTATTDDNIIECNGAFDVTLYTAVSNTGRQVTVKNTGTSEVGIVGTSSQTIEGETRQAIASKPDSFTFYSDGTNWRIM